MRPTHRSFATSPSLSATSYSHPPPISLLPHSQIQRPLPETHQPMSTAKGGNMQNINIPADSVTEGLKPIEQILKRAKELKLAEPIVSYWCCFSAAQKALKVQNRSKEDTIFLMSLIDALEQATLANSEAITSEAAGAAYVENFALKVFMSADNDDRAGITGKATIRKFVVAGQFIEVLRCFEHGMTEEMEQKLQYARWKAADGAKALREGRTPTVGPPIPENDGSSLPAMTVGSPGGLPTQLQSPPKPFDTSRHGSFSSGQRPAIPSPPLGTGPILSPRPSPALSARNNAPTIDTSISLHTPKSTNSGSGAWSTVATPGLPDEDDAQLHFDLHKSDGHVSSSSVTPPEGSPPGERKNVRFMGPDGAPLSPASTQITISSYTAPPAPPPTDISSPRRSPKPVAPVVVGPPPGRPRGDSSASSRSSGEKHHPIHQLDSKHSSANAISIPRPRRGSTASQRPNVPSSVSVPPAPPPSLASVPARPPPVQPHSHGLGLTSPTPAPKSLSRKDVEQTQKHAKWAISALEFDDYETARSELRKALKLLGG
nr:vacuolar protein sorting-associated protein VTA1 [Cryptococcus depauperatus CBS 7841]